MASSDFDSGGILDGKTIKGRVGLGSEIGEEEEDAGDAVEAVSTPAEQSKLTAAAKRHRFIWANKHRKHKLYSNQHNKDPNWFKHEKHFLVLSWAGRPIYSRYGDETKMAAYMGVVTAIITNFQRAKDEVRTIFAGEHKFVFLVRGPIFLVCISRSPEAVSVLLSQLHYVHQQILSILTGAIHRALEDRPQTDIRALMGGAENQLSDLLSDCDRSPTYLMDSVVPLRMPRADRAKIGTCLRKGKSKNLLYVVLLAGSRVVNVVRGAGRVLHPPDLLLAINMVTNSLSMRNAEAWTPICLPAFSDKGYLYAYVCYLAEDVCLFLITADPNDFHTLRECKLKIVESMEKKNCMAAIEKAMINQDIVIEELETGVPELRHFLYKAEGISQVVFPGAGAPWGGRLMQRHLFRRYQHIYARLNHPKALKRYTVYYEMEDSAAILAFIRPGEFQMYSAFTALVPRDQALMACNRAARYMKREEANLFIL